MESDRLRGTPHCDSPGAPAPHHHPFEHRLTPHGVAVPALPGRTPLFLEGPALEESPAQDKQMLQLPEIGENSLHCLNFPTLSDCLRAAVDGTAGIALGRSRARRL